MLMTGLDGCVRSRDWFSTLSLRGPFEGSPGAVGWDDPPTSLTMALSSAIAFGLFRAGMSINALATPANAS